MCELRLEVGKTYENESGTLFYHVVAIADPSNLPEGANTQENETALAIPVDEKGVVKKGQDASCYFIDGRYVCRINSVCDLVRERKPAKETILVAYDFEGRIVAKTYSKEERPLTFSKLSGLQVGDCCSKILFDDYCDTREIVRIEILKH